MVSKSITVRFNKKLYKKIKESDVCTSRLIRNAVTSYLNELEKKESGEQKNNRGSACLNVEKCLNECSTNAEETLSLLTELKSKLDDLNDETKKLNSYNIKDFLS